MNYFALFDKQTNCYLLTGFNSNSIEELMDAYINYKQDDVDLSDLPLEKVINWCKEDNFIIVESYKPIEE